MPYNIEEHEDYLKHHSPYKMDAAAWQAMQERVKENVMASVDEEKAKKVTFSYWKITAVAASIMVIIANCFLFWPVTQSVKPDENIAYNKTDNPEKQLDAAIDNLNESELNWMHQLSENEITEQNEYFEN